MAKLDWVKARQKELTNRTEISSVLPFKKETINAYTSLIDIIKKVNNEEWTSRKKDLKKQERYKKYLYRELNRYLKHLVEARPDFKKSKLYRTAKKVQIKTKSE